jgi:uncharacterized protein (TIGR03083 family)
MENPAERVEVLRQETAAFKERVAALSSADWDRPSACEGWSVADVMAHLSGQAFALNVSRGLQGDSSSPTGATPATEHNEDEFARNIFQRAFNTRAEFGDRLQETLFQRLDESVDVFNGVDQEQWDNQCYWPPGPEPVRTMLDMRISELTMHAWDVCSQFDPDYRLSDGSVRVLMDTVNRAARRAFRPDPTIPAPQVYQFVIDHPVEVVYELVIANEEIVLRPGETGEKADVVFQCDGETYVMVMYGRLTPNDALVSGKMDWDGNERLALGFGARFLGG